MSLQMSTSLRNARADLVETHIGPSPIAEMRVGAPPANPAAADSGALLAQLTLPANWLTDAVAGVKSLAGLWQDLLANGSGVAGHWRIKDSTGTTCHLQGTCSLPGAGGDMELINTNIAVNQPITVTAWTLTEGNQ